MDSYYLNITHTNTSENLKSLIEQLGVESKAFISIKTLIVVLILLIYTIANPIFEKFNFFLIQESGVCMIIGALINFIAILINPKVRYI